MLQQAIYVKLHIFMVFGVRKKFNKLNYPLSLLLLYLITCHLIQGVILFTHKTTAVPLTSASYPLQFLKKTKLPLNPEEDFRYGDFLSHKDFPKIAT